MASKKPAAKPAAKNAAATLSGSTALAIPAPRAPVALPEGVRVRRLVTVPSLVLKDAGNARTLLIQSEIRVSKIEGKKGENGVKEKPADICDVTDLETGEQFIFLVPAVVKSNLERDYGDDVEGYVGKAFYIRCDGKRNESQRYKDYTIIEVEPVAQ